MPSRLRGAPVAASLGRSAFGFPFPLRSPGIATTARLLPRISASAVWALLGSCGRGSEPARRGSASSRHGYHTTGIPQPRGSVRISCPPSGALSTADSSDLAQEPRLALDVLGELHTPPELAAPQGSAPALWTHCHENRAPKVWLLCSQKVFPT